MEELISALPVPPDPPKVMHEFLKPIEKRLFTADPYFRVRVNEMIERREKANSEYEK